MLITVIKILCLSERLSNGFRLDHLLSLLVISQLTSEVSLQCSSLHQETLDMGFKMKQKKTKQKIDEMCSFIITFLPSKCSGGGFRHASVLLFPEVLNLFCLGEEFSSTLTLMAVLFTKQTKRSKCF